MSDKEKSTDPGLTTAERKSLRSREAKEAIDDHEETQNALHRNMERLRTERLGREAATGPMLYPAPRDPGQHADRARQISIQDWKRALISGLEDHRRSPWGVGHHAVKPPGVRNGIGCSAEENAGAKGEKMRLDLWTPGEDAKLRALALAGLSLAEISQHIGRPKAGVRDRAGRLEIAIARDQNGMQKRARFKK
jgi:hypothetical protein